MAGKFGDLAVGLQTAKLKSANIFFPTMTQLWIQPSLSVCAYTYIQLSYIVILWSWASPPNLNPPIFSLDYFRLYVTFSHSSYIVKALLCTLLLCHSSTSISSCIVPSLFLQFLQDFSQFGEAEDLLNKAIKMAPDNPLSHFSLG